MQTIEEIVANGERFCEDIEVRDTKSVRGRGIFAKNDISKGTVIICSKAVIYTENPTPEVVEKLFSEIEGGFSQEQKADYENLQKSHGDGICSAFSTNAYKTVPNLSDTPKVGLFLKFSFMNHSCCPSTIQVYQNDYVVVKTTKNISKDEEITTSYLHGDNFWWEEGRQNYLKPFNFTCGCELCCYQKQRSFINLQIEFDQILKQKRQNMDMSTFQILYLTLLQKLTNTQFPMVDGFYEILTSFLLQTDSQNKLQIINLIYTIFQNLEVYHRPDFTQMSKIVLSIKGLDAQKFDQMKDQMYNFEKDKFGGLNHIYRKYKKQIEKIGRYEK